MILDQGGTWTEVKAFGIDPPACIESRKTRDNHLGNSLDGQTPNFNWTIPGLDEANIGANDNCVLRMRFFFYIIFYAVKTQMACRQQTIIYRDILC